MNTNRFKSVFHQSAALYAEHLRFAIVPIASGGKNPIISEWPQKATSDRQILDGWWEQWPNANVGFATGQKSQVVVLDIDNRLDRSANDVLANLQKEFGNLPATPYVFTGGGGYHFFFRLDQPLAKVRGFRPGVDVQADGAQIVLPPSIHHSGNQYRWCDTYNLRTLPLAPIPENIFNAVKFYKSNSHIANTEQRLCISNSTPVAILDGERNDSLFRIASKLLRYHLVDHAYTMIHAINEKHCQPPLPKTEVATIFHSVAKYEVKRLGGAQ
jgi:putative DNA primase/helicase